MKVTHFTIQNDDKFRGRERKRPVISTRTVLNYLNPTECGLRFRDTTVLFRYKMSFLLTTVIKDNLLILSYVTPILRLYNTDINENKSFD